MPALFIWQEISNFSFLILLLFLQRGGSDMPNKAIDAIGRLEHLANKSAYEYTAEQVEAMFGALENKVADVKAKFSTKKQDNTSFSFGTHAE